jgi:predicted F0F1-ATPase subunit
MVAGSPDDPFRRDDARNRTRRDIDRLRGREPEGRFWRSLALIGSVGWPIVLLATGGALLGRYLDAHLGTGVRFTLMLLTVGTVLGTWIAFRTLRRNGS